MKWELLAIGAVTLFVMLMFGMALISSGQKELSSDTLESPEYAPVALSVDVILNGLFSAPFALLIMAAAGAFYFLFKKTR